NSFLEYQRGGLELIGGKLYIPFTGNDPTSGFHGWLLVYDPVTLSPVDAFNATPNASKGGIAAAPSSDSNGKIYLATGQGLFDSALVSPSRKTFGETLIKLQPPPFAIGDTTKDVFTPFNQQSLTLLKRDFGRAGPLILPDSAGSASAPHLAIIGGSDSNVSGSPGGVLYLLDRDNL